MAASGSDAVSRGAGGHGAPGLWSVGRAEVSEPAAPGYGGTVVVLPTFNESAALASIVVGVRSVGCEVVVVDDGSPDGTGDLADRLAATDRGVHVIHRSGKLGLGTAYRAGLRWGMEHGYDLLVTMDADGSHRPTHLASLIAAAGDRRCVAIGSRYVRGGSIAGWTLRRRMLSLGANLYCRSLLGVRVRDCTSGYRCYPREVVEALDLESIISDGYAFLIEALHRCLKRGIPVVEVPIRFDDRIAGRSKVTLAEMRKELLLVPRLRLTPAWRGRSRAVGEEEVVDLVGSRRDRTGGVTDPGGTAAAGLSRGRQAPLPPPSAPPRRGPG